MFDIKTQHENNSGLNVLQKLQDQDREWFAQNPDREFRLRRARPPEYSGAPAFGEFVWTIIHRDKVDMLWDREFFKEGINFDSVLSDAQILAILAVLRKLSSNV